jgi:hypothetical protein
MIIKLYKTQFRDGRSANPPIPPGGRQVYLITHVIPRLGTAWVRGYQRSTVVEKISWSGDSIGLPKEEGAAFFRALLHVTVAQFHGRNSDN